MIDLEKTRHGPTTTSDVCRGCGASLPQLHRGRPRVVLRGVCAAESKRHATAKWRRNGPVDRLCAWCTVAKVPNGGTSSRYCSQPCASQAVNARKREARAHKRLVDTSTVTT